MKINMQLFIKEKINPIKKFLTNNIEILLLFISLILLVSFTLTFLIFGDIRQWDGIAHIENARYIRDFLWPDYSGYNPNYLMGYQQGIYYPPLFSYTLAILGFLLPIELAGKLLLTIILLSIPISAHYFAKKLKLERKQKMLLIAGITLSWFVIDLFGNSERGAIGIGPKSTFAIGLFTSFALTPIIFLFLGSLVEALEDEKKWKKASIILAMAFLTHFIGYILIIPCIIAALVYKKKTWITSIKIIGTSLILTAFWWIPLLAYKEFIPEAIFPITLNVAILLATTISIVAFVLLKNKPAKIIAGTIITTTALMHLFKEYDIPFQYYKLQAIILLLFTIPLLFLFFELNKKRLAQITLILLFGLALIGASDNWIVFPSGQTNILDKNTLKGQTLFLKEESVMSDYHEQYISFVNQTKSKSLRGLFVEGTHTSELICVVAKRLDERDLCWGLIPPSSYDYSKKVFEKQAKALALNNVVSSKDNNFLDAEKKHYTKTTIKYTKNKLFFIPIKREEAVLEKYIYNIGNYSEVELPNKVIGKKAKSFKEWTSFVRDWFYSEDETIYYYSDSEDRNIYGSKEARLVNYELRNKNQEILIEVDSNENVPIVVKQNWTPNWKAYNEKGEQIKIYITTPYSMLVVGKGRIILKNEKTRIEDIARIISLFGFIGLAFTLIKNIHNNKRESRKTLFLKEK